MIRRRAWLAALPGAWLPPRAALAAAPPLPAGAAQDPTSETTGVTHRALRFPADHGVHPQTNVEWWYVTGWMRTASVAESRQAAGVPAATDHPPGFGFQVTFFRRRTGVAQNSSSRFAARQLVFAHVALTDLGADRGSPVVLLDQRIAREGLGLAELPGPGGAQTVHLRDWTLTRDAATPNAPGTLHVAVAAQAFALDLTLTATQPVLLQGDAGFSQKGPETSSASRYYSEPQLALRGRVTRAGAGAGTGARAATHEVVGRAWLDHEWSDAYVPPGAQGWDWLGMNLQDGGALMAFRLRQPDGRTLWAGGTLRSAGGDVRTFRSDEVSFQPGRRWKSPRTQVEYPVEWDLVTPAGRWRVAALLDDQELDSRASTGAIYWEGLAALRTTDGATAGWGYLELTGYLERLRT